eukprot:CAMPEP_0115113372 /NCGR_PEP_ID=MMETSP0227-20121206/41317_1 /TAXON_ID=89957 /ORGANISM="Polarella glacialis, Strain CCMP 1383" /LENGTH=132 /DNA_ID=CAMNT_0002513359 /DNA_START=736 /DNA_END=1134 /DNA_ORIENTATION=+
MPTPRASGWTKTCFPLLSEPRVAELASPLIDFCPDGLHLRIVRHSSLEVLQLLAMHLLELKRNSHAPVHKLGNLDEVLLCGTSGGHRRGADANATGRQSGDIPVHCVAVQGDAGSFADLFHLRARQAEWSQV